MHGTNFATLRVSYGNGNPPCARTRIAIGQARRRPPRTPPDLAFTRWALEQNGKLVAYHNRFVHVGHKSAVGNSGAVERACLSSFRLAAEGRREPSM